MPDSLRTSPINVAGLTTPAKQTLQQVLLNALSEAKTFSDKSKIPLLARAIVEELGENTYPDEPLPRYIASRLLLTSGFTEITDDQKTELVEIVKRIINDNSCLEKQPQATSLPPTAHLTTAGQTLLASPQIKNPKADPKITDPKSDDFDLVGWVRDIYFPSTDTFPNLVKRNSLRDTDVLKWVDEIIKPIDPDFDPYKYIKKDSIVTDEEWGKLSRELNINVFPKINLIITQSPSLSEVGVAKIIPELSQTIKTLGGRRIPVYIINPLYKHELFGSETAFLDRVIISLEILKKFEKSHTVEVALKKAFDKPSNIDFASNPYAVISYIGAETFGELSPHEALKKFRVYECSNLGAMSDSYAFTKALCQRFNMPYDPHPEHIAAAILAEGTNDLEKLKQNGINAQEIIHIEAILSAMLKSDNPIYYLSHHFHLEVPGINLDIPPVVYEEPPAGFFKVEELVSHMQTPTPSPQYLDMNEKYDTSWNNAKTYVIKELAPKIFNTQCTSMKDFYRFIGKELNRAKPKEKSRVVDRINQRLRNQSEVLYRTLFFTQDERNRNCPGWNS